jgi:hypothetical protein
METILPHLGAGKEFAIIGLFGTLTYTFIQISTPVLFLQDLTNAYLAILGSVLLLSYLMRIVIQHRARPNEKMISLSSWIFGSLISTIYEVQYLLSGDETLLAGGTNALLAGLSASIYFFLTVIFIEETLWAVRKKLRHKLVGKN